MPPQRSPQRGNAGSKAGRGGGLVTAGLSTISGRLFPETRQLMDGGEDEAFEEFTMTNTQIASSLPLQMIIFFHVYFSIFWGAITLATMIFKELYLETNAAYRILSPLLFSVWVLFEPLRLYFGYVGNLQEKVPQLTGFWLFTLLPQLPISFFFILSLPLRVQNVSIQLPFDRAGSIVLFAMTAIECVVGYYALRVMVKSQVLKFHLQRTRDEGAAAVGRNPNRV